MAQQNVPSVETLTAIAAAFNAHDLDAIMEFFADDCSLDMPRGPEPWGQRFHGKAAVREGLASRFKGLPDVHYSDDRHWVSGNLGVSEWLLTGTTPDGRSEYGDATTGNFATGRSRGRTRTGRSSRSRHNPLNLLGVEELPDGDHRFPGSRL
jgi:ketosteroid isomerase-like protein